MRKDLHARQPLAWHLDNISDGAAELSGHPELLQLPSQDPREQLRATGHPQRCMRLLPQVGQEVEMASNHGR